ncbi:MAG: LysR substrate-binding domain-containing protein [Actinomycetota bacterium]|nr:LysR substrate-binding domain-containing protein [Actinomycetota bacterium]
MLSADVALPADHPRSDRASIDLTELEGQACISWPRGSFCHDWLTHYRRRSGMEPHIAHTAMEHATQLALVAAGLGAAVVPRLDRGPVPDGVVMVAVDPPLTRTVRVAAAPVSEISARP